ncbi:MAG: DUF1830 domain-containing protein [Cyanobacteria bacterium M_surface_10_m2_179]|nr:DUF1830 domain-containing protein [Cyanobacteria bacterium M_surface_10_m2_179]
MAQLTCGYHNSSDRMVIVRCIGPEEFFLERVVFPFELLSFLAPAQSVVQIWTHGLGGAELRESLSVEDLSIEAAGSEEATSDQPTSEPQGASLAAVHDAQPLWQQAS